MSPVVWQKERLDREVRKEKERLAADGMSQEEGCVDDQEKDVEWKEPPCSMFSRVLDGLGGNVVFRYCFRFSVVRSAG